MGYPLDALKQFSSNANQRALIFVRVSRCHVAKPDGGRCLLSEFDAAILASVRLRLLPHIQCAIHIHCVKDGVNHGEILLSVGNLTVSSEAQSSLQRGKGGGI
jgi:hypothetical protein